MSKSEDSIQSECYVWFNNTYPEYRGLLFAVPNGGARSSLQGKIFKMTGVYPGVADMLFLFNNTVYCIEMKNEYGLQSDKQIDWQNQVENFGYKYFIVRNLILFQSLIKSIINKQL